MVRRSGSVSLLFLALVSVAAFGQAAAPGSPQTSQAASAAPAAAVDPVMPKDANALMALAARVNGLASTDTKPWHLKATYQTFDADGKPKDTGTFEEWWAGPEKYKISYADPDFHQVEYKNGEKTEILGDKGWRTLPREMVKTYLNHPLPDVGDIAKENCTRNDRKVGKVNLSCVEPRTLQHFSPADQTSTMFCFDPAAPVVRLEESDGHLFVLFNNSERMNGHQYLEQHILVENENQRIVDIEVTSVAILSSAEEAMFAPAAAAVPGPGPRVSPGVITGKKIGGQAVHYPVRARQNHVQGMVMLEATINKTGDIEGLEVVSGPSELQKSTVDAVKTWKYKPYLLNGQPVDVMTEINVIYTLGG